MNSISKPTSIDIFLLVLVAMIWGSAFTSMKISIVEIGSWWTATGRVVIGFLALLPFCLRQGFQFPNNFHGWLMIAVISLLNTVLPFLLIAWGLRYVGAGVGALLMGIGPLIALLLSHFLTDDDRINLLKAFGVLFGFSGVVLIVGRDAVAGFHLENLIAQMAILFSTVCYVSAGLMVRKINMRPIPFTTLMLGNGSIALIIFTFLIEGSFPGMPSQNVMLAMLWLGVFPTGLAFMIRYYLIQRIGVSLFALGINLVPVFGIVTAAIILDEAIELYMLIALCCVLFGLVLARKGSTGKIPTDRRIAGVN